MSLWNPGSNVQIRLSHTVKVDRTTSGVHAVLRILVELVMPAHRPQMQDLDRVLGFDDVAAQMIVLTAVKDCHP